MSVLPPVFTKGFVADVGAAVARMGQPVDTAPGVQGARTVRKRERSAAPVGEAAIDADSGDGWDPTEVLRRPAVEPLPESFTLADLWAREEAEHRPAESVQEDARASTPGHLLAAAALSNLQKRS